MATTRTITLTWGLSEDELKDIRYALDESVPVKPATMNEAREWIRHQIERVLDNAGAARGNK